MIFGDCVLGVGPVNTMGMQRCDVNPVQLISCWEHLH